MRCATLLCHEEISASFNNGYGPVSAHILDPATNTDVGHVDQSTTENGATVFYIPLGPTDTYTDVTIKVSGLKIDPTAPGGHRATSATTTNVDIENP